MQKYDALSSTLSANAPPSVSAKQPPALYLLFFTEMWERFSYYGMRALLVLYMTSQLKYDDVKANLVYGAYTACVYAMPLLGGFLADRLLGYRKAVMLGGLVMMLGHFVLAIPSNSTFFVGLACLVCGNGFFKPNISTMVGKLYEQGDPRRDSGFSFFYMGINIGAFFGSLLCGFLGQKVDWHLGFGLAGVFMLLGIVTFTVWQARLGDVGLPPEPDTLSSPSPIGLRWETAIYLGAFLSIPIFVYLISSYEVMNYIMTPLCISAFGYLLFVAFREGGEAGGRLLVAVILIFSSALFWAFFEQGGGSLNLFANRNVDMNFFGTELSSAAVNNALNPFFVIVFSAAFASIWLWLASRNIEPTSPVKFALGFLQLGLGFYVFVIGGKLAGESGMVNLAFLALGYVFISTGELCLSPIGLSAVTKLSPARMTGMVMGAWFLASAFGQYLAGIIGTWMAIPHDSGAGALKPIESLAIYSGVFEKITLVCIGAAVVLFLLVPFMNKQMHGVK
jgi:POT family proton-dependent oligopeptide transporter